MIQLGSKVRDIYSGFQGMAVAKTDYLYGCSRVAVEPDLDEKGLPQEWQWFDEQRIEPVEVAAPRLSVTATAQTGGPGDTPPQRPTHG